MASLPNLTPKLLQNTLRLIKLYNTFPKFRQNFDLLVSTPRVLFQGVPLKVYLRVITSTSLKYRKYEKEVRANPDKFKELLILFYKDPREFGNFEKIVQETILGKNIPKFLTEEEIVLVKQIEKTPEGKEKENYISQLEQKLKISQPKVEVPQERKVPKVPREIKLPQLTKPQINLPNLQIPKLPQLPQLNLPRIQIPIFAKDLALNGQLAASKFINVGLPKILSGTGRGIVSGLGFGGKAATIVGGVGAKAALGALGPVGIAIAVAPTIINTTKENFKRMVIICGTSAGVILILIMPGGLLQTNSLLPPFATLGEAAELPPSPGYSGGEIASCKFTRGDLSPKEAVFESPRLLSYIQEASRISTIPAVVLAAFMRVEVPSVSSKNDETLASVGCPKSTTGALGLMQIQPRGTKGHDEAAVAQGARLIGKSYNELTEADYCDMQKNITIGAGFILKKMSYRGYGDGTKWDTAWTNDKKALEVLVDGYYGCHLYGGQKDCTGPYNYADDVWTSIQSCKTLPSSSPPEGNYQAWIKDNFGLELVNLDAQWSTQSQKWTAEILNTTLERAPKFKNLLHKQYPTLTLYATTGLSQVKGKDIYIRQRPGTSDNETMFKILFIHELGHIIRNTDVNYYNQAITAARNKDGGSLTYYSQYATPPEVTSPLCYPYDTNLADEDFAESVTYFINSEAGEQNYGNGCSTNNFGVNPYKIEVGGQKKFQAHYNLMESLLK